MKAARHNIVSIVIVIVMAQLSINLFIPLGNRLANIYTSPCAIIVYTHVSEYSAIWTYVANIGNLMNVGSCRRRIDHQFECNKKKQGTPSASPDYKRHIWHMKY